MRALFPGLVAEGLESRREQLGIRSKPLFVHTFVVSE